MLKGTARRANLGPIGSTVRGQGPPPHKAAVRRGPVEVHAGKGAVSRRLPSEEQQVLRTKGRFKIIPQSKVPVSGAATVRKGKPPLTAKQKLLAKMKR
ncbi:unnamed protein product [Choristocarpus tenellus]